jgi:uridylate kinase
MPVKKRILLKVSGELLGVEPTSKNILTGVIAQIVDLSATHQFGIVIGGGNFFRGSKQGKTLGMSRSAADAVGMLATVMNGLILQDLLAQAGLSAVVASSIVMPSVVLPLNDGTLKENFKAGRHVIFVGGTGCPFVTTDTNAVIRALQIDACQLWKATKVAGVFDKDPMIDKNANYFAAMTYQQMLDQHLLVMDRTAIILAQENKLVTKIFNVFTDNALHRVACEENFGSTIS